MKEKVYSNMLSSLVLLTMIVLMTLFVTADPEGADVRILNSTRGNLSGGTAGDIYTEAGNITQMEVNGTMITKSWQGLFGNITGNITLQDSSGHKMYDWALGNASGEVYASRASSITWHDGTNPVNCSNMTLIASEETTLGQGAGDSDNISGTFFQSVAHPTFTVGNWQINSTSECYAAYTYVSGVGQDTVYAEVILHDPSDNVIWATIINDSAIGYDGAEHDFQMIVPEDGHDAQADVRTQYYFWVELE